MAVFKAVLFFTSVVLMCQHRNPVARAFLNELVNMGYEMLMSRVANPPGRGLSDFMVFKEECLLAVHAPWWEFLLE